MRGDRNATDARRHPADDERTAEQCGQETAGSAGGLTPGQLTATQTAMALLVEDDLARGVPPWETEYCPACTDTRPRAGFVSYDRASADGCVCNTCATEYEIARMQGLVPDIREFLRGKTYGDTAAAPLRA